MLTDRANKAAREIALVGCLVLAFSCAVQAAIPSAEECKTARAKLAELTSDDYKALKAKTKTNEQVGDALAQYADNEESAAGKFALLQDAFQQYVLGKSVDKAESVYSKAQSVGGMEYALEMARPSRSKLSAYATSKNAPAKLLKERIAADEKSFQRVAIVKAKLKKAPGDESLCEQLGIEYAAIGDWESALAAFVTAAGEVAKVADWELNGGKGVDYTAATVGAFWWKFADNFPKRKNVKETMKLHAAMWYKLALDKDAFKGNEKTIIEKRIAETEKLGASEQAEKELAVKKMATLDPIKLEFSKDNIVELIGCPAGEFMMGKKGDDDKTSPTRYHKVKITRPFWMSRYKVQKEIWKRFEKIEWSENCEKYLGGGKCIHMVDLIQIEQFFRWINSHQKFMKLLPKGYVFRLPTDAEWEYALTAGNSPNDQHIRFRDGFVKTPETIAVTLNDIKARWPKALSPWISGAEAGLKKPNAWGFFDMLGSGGDVVLDIVDADNANPYDYQSIEVDPLRFFDGASAQLVKRGCGDGTYFDIRWYRKETIGVSCVSAFHIVLGPDLMKEKGYQNKPKKKAKKR